MKTSSVKYHSTLFLWMMCFFSFGQADYRNTGFVRPMDLSFNLAGCFGEPRKDHFHSGIDIKTNGVEGEPVFAALEGYVSRIKVSPYGYGKAIYITHPNGFTSVYGHLSRFNEVIEKYVHAQHYALKKSELDLYPDTAALPVKTRERIAYSGNTGGSGGPHLHFEIRETKSEHALNPLNFFPEAFYEDTLPPSISAVKIYALGNGYYNATANRYALIRKENYLTTSIPVHISADAVGIAVQGFDKQLNNDNKNGIDRIVIKNDAGVIFQYTIDEIDFDKTRMVSAFMDYEEQQKNNTDVYQCFRLPNNSLPVYDILKDNGYIKTGGDPSLTIECYDFNRNKTEIRLELAYSAAAAETIDTVAAFPMHRKNVLKQKECMMLFPEDCFYDDLTINYSMETGNKNSILSNIHKVGSGQFIPMNKAGLIEIKARHIPVRLRSKAMIIRRDFNGTETALTSTRKKNWLNAGTKQLGDFYIKADTTPPAVAILNLRSEIQQKGIRAKITDNLAGIATYNGYIDGQWVNFYYDAKNDLLTYDADEYCSKGEHILTLIVTDTVGNKTIAKQKFNY